ncbi:hypothetical protein L9F63_005841, partial [Diploptera punctata]
DCHKDKLRILSQLPQTYPLFPEFPCIWFRILTLCPLKIRIQIKRKQRYIHNSLTPGARISHCPEKLRSPAYINCCQDRNPTWGFNQTNTQSERYQQARQLRCSRQMKQPYSNEIKKRTLIEGTRNVWKGVPGDRIFGPHILPRKLNRR